MEAGIRQVKNHFSKYLRRVKQGEILLITERNVPVAKMIPINKDEHLSLLHLVEQGIASWGGGKPRGMATPPSITKATTIAELVGEDRR